MWLRDRKGAINAFNVAVENKDKKREAKKIVKKVRELTGFLFSKKLRFHLVGDKLM